MPPGICAVYVYEEGRKVSKAREGWKEGRKERKKERRKEGRKEGRA
jgi:hypothetical protein